MKDIKNIWGIDPEPLLDPFESPFHDSWNFENELRQKKEKVNFYSSDEYTSFLRWERERKYNIKDIYEESISNLEKNEEYYYGCSFNVYKKNYSKRLERFLSNFKDSEEEDFIEYELEKGIMDIPYNSEFFSLEQLKKFRFSLKKRFAFLQEQSDLLGFDIPKDLIADYWMPETNEKSKTKDVDLGSSDHKKGFADYELIPDPATKSKSLNWKSPNTSKLNEIYKKLEDNGYVNCGLVQFKKIFSNTSEFKPVEWLEGIRSLSYFYGLLIDKKLILTPKPKWPKLHEVFISSEGINSDSAKTEWSRRNKGEGNSKLFSSLESLIHRA
ncbi:hypothetical protein SAMN05444483_103360 [Salegentibacter echinorum]|uniref:Uncharacterized protein n=1 Tax=Salegentibacter echinorum TaxID=1073325 RepID=A0A1M5FUM3_SALEC|nr:hypothetical protein [Salegentibacter echinorum]SHF95166.1 hypothetical protein SAMN05444483_103360 [Salegentibacter echinorum]